MSDLLKRMMDASPKDSVAMLMGESHYLKDKDMIPTEVPIINAAFSGKLDGGVVSGITILSGKSKSFKTLLALLCLKSYLDKYPEALGIFYDNEGGVTEEYLLSLGIDLSRVLFITAYHVEQVKFDMVKRLDAIKRGDEVFFIMDSLGMLASKKEVDDALKENSVADMSRAKAIRSLFRNITIHFKVKDIPAIFINHVYEAQDNSHTQVIPGGQAVTLAADTVLVISRSQEKAGDTVVGYNFNISVEKSRFVKERSKLSFTVYKSNGIAKYSGMLELAIESGYATSGGGWFQIVNFETGELEKKKVRQKEITKEWYKSLISFQPFKDYVENKYILVNGALLSEEELAEEDELDKE